MSNGPPDHDHDYIAKAIVKIVALMIGILIVIAGCQHIHGAPPAYTQPEANDVREIVVTKVHDGDTITADVYMGALGGTEIVLRGVRLRLKDVSAFEILDDPNKQDAQERATGIMERDALAKMLFGAKHVTARLYRHGTFDRHDADIFTETLNCNAQMRTYPQGGRGVK